MMKPMQPLRSQNGPPSNALAGELAAWGLLRNVDTEVSLSELSAARILGRISSKARQPVRAYPRWLVAAAAVAISLLGLQVAAAAVIAGVPTVRRALGAAIVHRVLGHREARAEARAEPRDVEPIAAPKAAPITAPVAEPLPRIAAPVPLAAVPEPRSHPATLRAQVTHAPKLSQPATATPSSRPEVEIMTQVARELYADHDPTAALTMLEPYLYLRPAGSLRPEMILAAVQADLELDRTPEALGLLDGLAAQDFHGIPRGEELRVLRAELLSRSQRCREALPEFGQSLTAAASPLRERALYGQATCRAQLGDLDGSRSDLRSYLKQFPGGRFASDIERTLGEKPHQ